MFKKFSLAMALYKYVHKILTAKSNKQENTRDKRQHTHTPTFHLELKFTSNFVHRTNYLGMRIDNLITITTKCSFSIVQMIFPSICGKSLFVFCEDSQMTDDLPNNVASK